MSDVILGVIIAGLLNLGGNFLNNLKEDKRSDKVYGLELLKIRREDKLNQLYDVLFPIIAIYTKSDSEQAEMENHYLFYGEGLKDESIKDIKKIINENKRFLTSDLIKIFNEVDGRYVYLMENDYSSNTINREKLAQDDILIEYIFDTDRTFIDFVGKEAKKIESEYC